jgi:hypothetical protein
MGKVGRRSKYTPDRVRVICDAIARSGSDKAGWQAGNISEATFYTWIEQFSEFSELVLNARAEYRNTCPETLVRQVNKVFSDLLHGRMEKIITTTKTGHSSRLGSYEEETIQRIPIGVPRWAIERVLGPAIDEFAAIQCLVQAGWLPRQLLEVTQTELYEMRSRVKELFLGILPNKEGQAKPGLSDETAAAIRAQILGIEPSNTVAETRPCDSIDNQPIEAEQGS